MNRRFFLRGLAALPFIAVVDMVIPSLSAPLDETPPMPLIAPRLANGGIIKTPGIYLVGEHGPEMTVPWR